MTATEKTKITFQDFNLDESIIKAITALEYLHPTEIQEKAIPEIRKNMTF